MSIGGEQILLRVYLESADRAPHAPTYERIVKAARSTGMAGATVLRGIMGFSARKLLQHKAWSLIDHVPVIVEIVDSADKIVQFIQQTLDTTMTGGIATLERAHVMLYRHGAQQQAAPNSLQLGALLEPFSTMPQIEPRNDMRTSENGVLLRIFIGESDQAGPLALYEAIVVKARELGLAGATVLRGSEGFGARSVVHKSKLLEMSTDLPLVIEIVDAEEKIKLLLPYLEQTIQDGMITMEHVVILMYRHGAGADQGPPAR
jgi:PII-like signaling protein